MKSLTKIGFIFGLALLLNLTFSESVFAENRLTDMKIEVELQEDGSGIITEHRRMNMDEGTELFIVMDELQDSELLDFSVTGFEEVEDWDSGDSLEEKAGKYGILETSDGLELVWGIGTYGENTYEVTYTLSNLVRELEDGQALLWNFDTFSDIPAENLIVEISGAQAFTEENTKLWGFGFDGDIQLVNGQVVWEAFEEVDNRNDVTVLLQFPAVFFNTQVSVDMNLEEQREMAMEGSSYNNETGSDIIPIIIVSSFVLLGAGGAALGINYASKIKKAKEEAGQMRTGSKRIVDNRGIVYDKIPFQGDDYAGIAYLLHQMTYGYFEDYFSAYLLKWIMEERIQMNTSEKNTMFSETYETEIEIFNYEEECKLHNRPFAQYVEDLQRDENELYETGLWIMLLDAADNRGFVNDDRIKNWAKEHAKEVEEYSEFLIDYSKDYLQRNDLIRFEEITVWGSNHEVAVASTEGDELFDRLVQFDNYLKEMELKGLDDSSIQLSLEEYLLWKVLYFKGAELTKEFKEFIPNPDDYYEDNNYVYYYWYWHGTTGFNQNWSTGLASGGFSSSLTSSASAGGGGTTSIGGGGGAGGGGGGGAR